MATHNEVSLLSEVEQLVLLAVLKLKGANEAYAVPIRELILKDAGVDLPRGSIYVTLERLEQKGLLHSEMSAPMAVKGGKARRVFGLRPAGMRALRVATQAMHKMTAGTVLAKG